MSMAADRWNSVVRLKENWEIQSSVLVMAPEQAIATEGFCTEGWCRTEVPTTVLSALVRAGIYPDPRIGLNNFRIPDVADEFNTEHNLARFSHLPHGRNPWKDPYWFRTVFEVPADCHERQWLCFDAINYRAEVWLNGRRVCDRYTMVGPFVPYCFDVTGFLHPGAANVLAIKVWGPDHPGVPTAQLEPFQKPRRHIHDIPNDIEKDVTINIAATG